MFKAGTQIRELLTGRLFLVIQQYKCGVMVVDLTSGERLNEPKIIVERDYDQFADDTKVDLRKGDYDEYKWGRIQL